MSRSGLSTAQQEDVSLAVLVPVLNEESLLEKALQELQASVSPYPVVVIDAGSTDQSVDIARRACSDYGWKLLETQMNEPSIGKTLWEGISTIEVDFFVVLPVDCRLSGGAFQTLLETLQGQNVMYGGFVKRYEPSSLLLDAYSFLQNLIRTQLGKNFVWTNGLFFQRKVFDSIDFPQDGFLEDVRLSDQLKSKFQPHIVSFPLFVSSRRYQIKTVLGRIAINGLILLLYRLGYRDISRLKKLYLLF